MQHCWLCLLHERRQLQAAACFPQRGLTDAQSKTEIKTTWVL